MIRAINLARWIFTLAISIDIHERSFASNGVMEQLHHQKRAIHSEVFWFCGLLFRLNLVGKHVF